MRDRVNAFLNWAGLTMATADAELTRRAMAREIGLSLCYGGKPATLHIKQ